MRMLAVSVMLLGVGGLTLAAAPKEERVQVKLMADVSAIRPGSSFTVGALFQVKEGWHVYWQNPGESGAPTTMKLKLPAGFTVGPVEYPTPRDLTPPDGTITYGYEGEVMLLAKVTAPKDLPTGSPVSIEATAGWFVCREVCVPGEAKLALSLDVADESQPANIELFHRWRETLPVAIDQARGVRVERLASRTPAQTARPFELQLRFESAPKRVEFFPLVPEALVIEQTKIEQAEQSAPVTIRFQVRQLPGTPKLAETSLPAVVVVTNQSGERQGIHVDFPFQDPQ